jgi:hypothetical protein
MKHLSNRAPPHARLCSSVPAGKFDLLLVPMRNIMSTVRANRRAADQQPSTSSKDQRVDASLTVNCEIDEVIPCSSWAFPSPFSSWSLT